MMNYKTFTLLCSIFLSMAGYSQHNHIRELGLKGKINRITNTYYAQGEKVNGIWIPKDSSKFTYKTVSFYNEHQNLDSIYTYVNHSGHERLISKKYYQYDDKKEIEGRQIDLLEDIEYSISRVWIDKHTYTENAVDQSGNNRINLKVWMDKDHHIIKSENELYREGELYDHSITETKINPDNTEHAVSITENKVSNLEYSLDEYVDLRDEKGNPIRISYKDGVNSFRSVRIIKIDYAD